MLCYYHDFIDKCLEVHGIDLTTIISDCVTAGYESRADEVIELRARLDQKVSRKNEYRKLYEEAKDKLYKVNAARKSKVDDNTARMQSIKQLGV